MKIIVKAPGQGKTRDLVRIASEKGYCVVTRNPAEIAHHAHHMGIPEPSALSSEEFVLGKFYGKIIKGFVVDDLEFVLELVAQGIPVRAVSMQCQRGDPSYVGR